MTFRGTIQNGRLVLDRGGALPDGTKVEVSVRPDGAKATRRAPKADDSLTKLAARAVRTGIRTLADDHDSLAYGPPKVAVGRDGHPTRDASGG
jgi:hypothetical protein